jgi:hypothetical protein
MIQQPAFDPQILFRWTHRIDFKGESRVSAASSFSDQPVEIVVSEQKIGRG